ncbi:MAG: phosphate transport system regulatory protein PhoU [Desulfobacteraceae bacterium 4572_88]|nr:MAG: phosphate transport system regulatory protein PhoU [Desulfobacteraceae bacterium 4572_88]
MPTKHFRRELENIKKKILSLGTMVEERVHRTIQSIPTWDAYIAERIIKADYEVDEMEVEIEEECLKILALHQPVAADLRFLIAVIKINNDLERIGDQVVNIAQRIKTISKHGHHHFVFDYSEMGDKAENMLKMSLDSLVNLDVDLAFEVCLLDDEVDVIKNLAYDQIKAAMKETPECVGYLINLLLISRHLERVADHATNIAEEVIYMIEGDIIRHDKGKPGDQSPG